MSNVLLTKKYKELIMKAERDKISKVKEICFLSNDPQEIKQKIEQLGYFLVVAVSRPLLLSNGERHCQATLWDREKDITVYV